MSPELARRLDFARALAIDAGRRTLRWFPAPLPFATPGAAHAPDPLGAERKGDGSIVTRADLDAESYMRDRLAHEFPLDAVLGEEFGARDGSSPFRWVIDPIDGTASFALGVPLFGTIIGIEDSGLPAAGAVFLPALGEIVWGSAAGAWHAMLTPSQADPGPAARPARVSSTPSLDRATLCSTSLDYFARAGCPALYPRLQAAVAQTRGWSDCYAFVLLATGRVDAVVEPKVGPWDVCGLIPIIEGAGGRATDFSGARSTRSGTIVASNGLVHSPLLTTLAGERSAPR